MLTATFGMLSSKPPPPNITTFEFHTVGNATRNWMSGAVVSTGEILPVTRQYSGIAFAPEPEAATADAAVTTAPAVGNPIDSAGMAFPGKSLHARRHRHRRRRCGAIVAAAASRERH
jgi:hypothetical protein